ncbi:MAG TPA: hypothetical protein VEJ16_09850 [Alphaproteobacteria bacterium]|nr:hypothetical protein [Alphaproteobacteria bacterium]
MRKWLFTYVLACVGCSAGVLLLFWAMNDFAGLGLDLGGTLAVIFGVTVTVALGITLMALVFASDRSDKDAEVGRSQLDKTDPTGN